MKQSILEAANTGYVLTDGAMGTELLRRGLPIGESAALWNIDKAEDVLAIHRSFVDAGSQCVVTNTFSANGLRLKEHGLGSRVADVNRKAVELARTAAGETRWVMGSLGPCSGFAVARGTFNHGELIATYAEQLRALGNAGVDGILLETVTDTSEMRAALEAQRSVVPTLPVMVSFCFRRIAGPGYQVIRSGESLDDVCDILCELKIDCVGANCGVELYLGDYITIAAAMRSRFSGPIIIRPNGGQLPACGEKVNCAESPEALAEGVWGLVRAGASIIGGCCGTTPEHIRLFSQEMSKL